MRTSALASMVLLLLGCASTDEPAVSHSTPTLTLTVKTLTGKTLALKGRESDSVLSLKRQITSLEGIPLDQQRMILAGKELDDAKTLGESGIVDGSALHLVLRRRGS